MTNFVHGMSEIQNEKHEKESFYKSMTIAVITIFFILFKAFCIVIIRKSFKFSFAIFT